MAAVLIFNYVYWHQHPRLLYTESYFIWCPIRKFHQPIASRFSTPRQICRGTLPPPPPSLNGVNKSFGRLLPLPSIILPDHPMCHQSSARACSHGNGHFVAPEQPTDPGDNFALVQVQRPVNEEYLWVICVSSILLNRDFKHAISSRALSSLSTSLQHFLQTTVDNQALFLWLILDTWHSLLSKLISDVVLLPHML